MFLLLPRFSNLLLAVRAAARRGRAENAGYVCVGRGWGGQRWSGGRFMGSTNLKAGGHMLSVLHATAGGRTRTLVHKAVAHTEQQPADARS